MTESNVVPEEITNQKNAITKNVSYRTVPILNGASWIVDGFRNFTVSPFTWLFVVALYFVMLGVLFILPFVSIFGWLIAPIFMAGLMLCARDNKNNGTFYIKNFFDGFSLNGGKLTGLGAVYLGLLLLLLAIVVIIVFIMLLGYLGNIESILNIEDINNIETLYENNLITQTDLLLVLLVLLLVISLMLPIEMAFWFAPALIIFHDVDIFTALKLSFMACLKNMLPFSIYGLVYIGIYFIAAIPFYLMDTFVGDFESIGTLLSLTVILGLSGVLVLTAIFITSIYASYEDIFLTES